MCGGVHISQGYVTYLKAYYIGYWDGCALLTPSFNSLSPISRLRFPSIESVRTLSTFCSLLVLYAGEALIQVFFIEFSRMQYAALIRLPLPSNLSLIFMSRDAFYLAAKQITLCIPIKTFAYMLHICIFVPFGAKHSVASP